MNGIVFYEASFMKLQSYKINFLDCLYHLIFFV